MTLKTKIFIKIICIFILIALILAIIIHAQSISADKCVVFFITKQIRGVILDPPLKIEVKAIELFQAFKDKKCIIKWEESVGYYRNG